jgi:hypothetical protein
MVGFKTGLLFLQRNLDDLHNSEHNVSLKKKHDVKYSEESPKNSKKKVKSSKKIIKK